MAEAEATTVTMTVKPELNFDESGKMAPKTFEASYRQAQVYLASKMLPVRFNTPESIVVGMQYALELGLHPLTGLRQIAVVQGTPCTFGDLPLAMVQRTGKMESINEYLIDDKGVKICTDNKNLQAKAVCAVCIVKRKGDPEPLERFFSLDDASVAGLGGSPTWKAYPKLMMKYRARSQALKDKFADCLNGIAIAEYDYNEHPNEESPRLQDAASDLNSAFDTVDAEAVDANEKMLKL